MFYCYDIVIRFFKLLYVLVRRGDLLFSTYSRIPPLSSEIDFNFFAFFLTEVGGALSCCWNI